MAFKLISFTYIELSSLLMRCKYAKFREFNQVVDYHIHIRRNDLDILAFLQYLHSNIIKLRKIAGIGIQIRNQYSRNTMYYLAFKKQKAFIIRWAMLSIF